MLDKLPRPTDPNLLVGMQGHDDAAVYRLGETLALVSTIDYITPVVDDPRIYGQVAAANALSDIYAMGARPILALNMVVFPRSELPLEVLEGILLGGSDKAMEAGVAIGGGHSVDGDVPLYGMAVSGVVDPARITTNNAARPGDRLFLSKPIGSGITIAAIRSDTLGSSGIRRLVARRAGVRQAEIDEMTSVLTRLNRAASEAMQAAGVRAATDVTGFGLAGHLLAMLAASGADGEVDYDAIPVLSGAARFLAADFVPDGSRRNLEDQRPRLIAEDGIGEPELLMICDAQTSGGLLMAAGDGVAEALRAECAARGVAIAEIGRVTGTGPGRLRVRRRPPGTV